MCGLAGALHTNGSQSSDALAALGRRMAAPLTPRGPDADGVWTDAEAGIVLAHTRLSIIDISPAGAQPMVSSDGRYVIAYNGELYNTAELIKDLIDAGCNFRGHSDTEAIVEACAAWGVERTLSRLNGMFAFALWDRRAHRLTLARDRVGIKPLCWAVTPKTIMFGSDLNAIRAHPACPNDLDRQAVALFMRHGCVPAPHTILVGVKKLEPGHILTFDASTRTTRVQPYWSLAETARAGVDTPFGGTAAEAECELDELLRDAVRRQMVSDVPLGAFLSGGIDSSTVVALMQDQSARPVKTFTIGFDEPGFNEAAHAKAVARHLGTEHTELYVTSDEARDVIPKLTGMYDEPFGDSSQIPTYLVSALARKQVTVSLSGDGGDELFAGYNRHIMTDKMSRRTFDSPAFPRRLAASALRAVSPATWDRASRLVPSRHRPPELGDKLHKLAAVLPGSADAMYQYLVSQWPDPAALVIGADPTAEAWGRPWTPELDETLTDPVNRARYMDGKAYLPDDVLTKVDRASMAVSLEARVPLLDHRVVEFAWRLPRSMLLRDGGGKWILRQVLRRYVPDTLVDRPKMGFGVPIADWLRGPLRPWAEDLLSPETFQRHGLLRPEPVWAAWREHLSGQKNWQHRLWNVLMLHAWCADR